MVERKKFLRGSSPKAGREKLDRERANAPLYPGHRFINMENLVTSNLKLGIIAGGQLAKMMIQEASKWDIRTHVLDGSEHCPARPLAGSFTRGSHLDYDAVYAFGRQVDFLTFEIESVNTDALRALKKEGLKILPDPEVLALIQDKGHQKDFFAQYDIPTADYRLFSGAEAIQAAIEKGKLGFPFVQKARRGGYDGRGVAVIQNESDLSGLLPGPSVVEDKVDLDKEIAVIVARNPAGEIRSYPVVEMAFDPEANLVEKLICPAAIEPELADRARSLASSLADALDMAGVLAVEFFLDRSGNLLVNEVAPRPHNSGHHTIESVITSQFEQHLRAVFNLPLGSTHLKMPAVMLNLLGDPGYSGPVRYHGLTESMAVDGVKLHIYGKTETRPFRKMGHATILAPTVAEAVERADQIKHLIRITT